MDKQQNKLAGAYVPQQVYNTIALYAVCKSKTKSKIIRDILTRWMRECSFNTREMEKMISQSVQMDWEKIKLSSLERVKNHTFHDFLQQARKDLKMKSIPKQSIDNIIEMIKI